MRHAAKAARRTARLSSNVRPRIANKASAHFPEIHFVYRSVVAAISLCLMLGGCDSLLASRLLVQADTGSAAAADVAAFVNEFAVKHAFACLQGADPVLLSCRAAGPRFLSLERKGDSSLLIQLVQPFNGPLSQAPRSYLEASKEIESSAHSKFGAAVTVMTHE